MDIIRADDISYTYENGINVIKDISIEGKEGSFVSIVGPSGCGKSTLLRIMAGLIKPTSGHVVFLDSEISRPVPGISFIFQDFALLPWLTNLDNVKLGFSMLEIPDKEKEARARKLIDKLGLSGFADLYPNVLSGGMKQRIGIARALASDPKVLLMDEPFSALDELTAEALRSEVLDMLKDKTIPVSSVIMITHNVEEAVELSDTIVVVSDKPSHVKRMLPVDLPYPRNRRDKKFQSIVDATYSVLTE